MNRKWIWFVPHVNGIVIGAILFAANGFDINAVIGPWMFIGLVLIVYSSALRSLPVLNSPTRSRATEQPRLTQAMTPTQDHYANVTAHKLIGESIR